MFVCPSAQASCEGAVPAAAFGGGRARHSGEEEEELAPAPKASCSVPLISPLPAALKTRSMRPRAARGAHSAGAQPPANGSE